MWVGFSREMTEKNVCIGCKGLVMVDFSMTWC